MFAVPVSNIIGAPLSGLLLGAHWAGIAGWRWMFLLEGLPAVVLGVVTLFVLADRPRDARWLGDDERPGCSGALTREAAQTAAHAGLAAPARAALRRAGLAAGARLLRNRDHVVRLQPLDADDRQRPDRCAAT